MKLVIQLAVLAAIVLLCIGAIDASPMKKLKLAVESAHEQPKLVKPIIMMETTAEAEVEVETGAEAEAEAEAETEVETGAEEEATAAAPVTDEELAEAKDHAAPFALLETSASTEAEAEKEGGGDSNPTYVLPYPPLMPHFFTPFLNPYSNVNPLSFPYNYYYGQGGRPAGPAPGGMAPGFAGPGMMQPAMGGAPAFGGGHPYYPYYSFMERRTHLPWQLRTVGVGANSDPTFPQFLETEAQLSTSTDCINCHYN